MCSVGQPQLNLTLSHSYTPNSIANWLIITHVASYLANCSISNFNVVLSLLSKSVSIATKSKETKQSVKFQRLQSYKPLNAVILHSFIH